ncbi:GNAT family N-acetyltransferase [Corynebacterium pseudotuberculosis]|uniref:GNAT family N-acetyltransferase n=1 Tax=Corynebacterium pseudotuberculosis (strain C231) TaxID=681645 RepID=D9Q9X7_CORP2|nr:GNAT family N-acetyltransferase [Corynebacterium pseudotuberculosis]ADK28667.1 GNAT family N-acetyltransferase [Corynebacterium pseudotuberculosis FRC41]ADL10353.1 GNAT family N-acetyltransferase [Corynebacterium pseudotuberculosis C231]ADL20758.1 GNAT family N-acetyltransferase [Corynebacterium pseudotuberculosis 1002]ADO26145.1 GNAT family N-acetyltransferase [Corynebacterium pseudotuberculosis I19]AEK92202.1 Mycothiol acetyltransferase [Corynebacterium pseudotuberculosis PAT10]
MANQNIILVPTQEVDRTYIARLNFLTDVYGNEDSELSHNFINDTHFYVDQWVSKDGGFIAWDTNKIPAGGAWLLWGTSVNHGYGYVNEEIPEVAIAVEARFRGTGVASLLLKAAIALAQSLGAPGISLSVDKANTKAQQVYSHLGFSKVSFDEASGFYIMQILF